MATMIGYRRCFGDYLPLLPHLDGEDGIDSVP